eukprot:3200978-Amphidinium_carterae.1
MASGMKSETAVSAKPILRRSEALQQSMWLPLLGCHLTLPTMRPSTTRCGKWKGRDQVPPSQGTSTRKGLGHPGCGSTQSFFRSLEAFCQWAPPEAASRNGKGTPGRVL